MTDALLTPIDKLVFTTYENDIFNAMCIEPLVYTNEWQTHNDLDAFIEKWNKTHLAHSEAMRYQEKLSITGSHNWKYFKVGPYFQSLVMKIHNLFNNNTLTNYAREGRTTHLKYARTFDNLPEELQTKLYEWSQTPGLSYDGYDQDHPRANFKQQVRNIYYYDLEHLRPNITVDSYKNVLGFISHYSEINERFENITVIDTYAISMSCDSAPEVTSKTIIAELLETIDENNDKIPEGPYLKMMTLLKQLNDMANED